MLRLPDEDRGEHLDLPPQRIPVQFLDRVRLTCDRQIGDQFPPDRLAAIRRAPLGRVDYSQFQGPVALVLADRRAILTHRPAGG